MKTLLLVRHAKSDWNSSSGSDFDRPLNSRGMKDAPFIADVVKNQGINPDLIISSPANRAKTTAGFFANAFNYPADQINFNDRIYSGSYKEILTIIASIDDKNETVFLFGHNPDITSLVSILSGNILDNMPTCGAACIDFDCDSWKKVNNENGKIRFFEYPKMY